MYIDGGSLPMGCVILVLWRQAGVLWVKAQWLPWSQRFVPSILILETLVLST